jgi:hypothetical protein
LALVDLNMPGSDGVASIRIFHHRFPGIPGCRFGSSSALK